MDDIVAFVADFTMAYENLEVVFKRLRAANLKLKPQKCKLFRDKLDYLGHEVGREGIRPSYSKIAGLHDWAEPETISEVRTFLGFTSYYRCFIESYSQIAMPLTRLLKKDSKGTGRKRLPKDARAVEECFDSRLSAKICPAQERFLAGC